jgi:hypothetical protein
VEVRDGTAVSMRGNPAHPYSQGELCPKVNRFLDRVYSPMRVTTPLRRVGAKGEGRFEPVSWDDALTEIATRFRNIIDTDGPGAIVPYTSAGNQGLLALFFGERLWNHLGVAATSGALCGLTAGAGAAATNGTGKALDPSEMRHSKLIILWATNTRLTNRHLWPVIEAARREGAQVVVIDPIRTITADSADWFLQPLPGTDVALMLAMMHVLMRDDLLTTSGSRRTPRASTNSPRTSPSGRPNGPLRSPASTPTTSSDWPPCTAPSGRQPSAPSSVASTTSTAPCSSAPSPACPHWWAPGATSAVASPAVWACGATQPSTSRPSPAPISLLAACGAICRWCAWPNG